MIHQSIRWSVLLFITALFLSCGYHFAGRGGSFPPDIKSIRILLFANETHEVGIENIFTNALINEFVTDKRVQIVTGGDADATIEGTIKSFKLGSISYQRDDIVQEYRATVILEVTLKRNNNGEVIWKDRNLQEAEEYRVAPSVAVAETNKRAAIVKIAEEVSEKIHDRILEGF